MFKCEACGRITNPREKQHKEVVRKRNKEYSNTYVDKYGNEFERKKRKLNITDLVYEYSDGFDLDIYCLHDLGLELGLEMFDSKNRIITYTDMDMKMLNIIVNDKHVYLGEVDSEYTKEKVFFWISTVFGANDFYIYEL